MKFEDFVALRNTIKYGSYSTWQLVLLFGDVTGRICTCEEFASVKKELSDIEEVMVESLDKIEDAKPYEPDPADLVHVD